MIAGPIEFDSEPIHFLDRRDDLVLVTPREQSQVIVMRPPCGPFRLTGAAFVPDDEDLDFVFIQIANVLCSAFAKRHPVCDVANNITIQVSYRGREEKTTRVRLRGIALIGAKSKD